MQISRLLYLILLCTTWPLLTKQHDLKKSCVQDINITDGNATHPYFKYKLHVLNDSECSLEKKKWIGKLVKCTDDDEELARIEITELEGYVCPIKTCQRLKVKHALSRNISALDDDISPMVYFVFFNTTGMQLTISQDERIRSWQLRICECVSEDNCKKGLCNVKKKMDSIGNNTFLEVKEDFLPDKCYYFKILPNSHSDCPLLTRGGFKHPSGCHPCGPASTSPQEHKQVFYQSMAVILLFFGPMAGVSSVLHVFLVVAGVTAVGIVAVIVVKKWWRVILATRTEEKYTLRREGVSKKSSVLVMYSPDNLVHLNTVSQFIVHLRKHLRCKVYDIFEKEDTEKMADPNWWLLEKMSAKFSMKVVLVLSDGVTQLLQTLLDGQELTDINDSQRNSAERSTFTDIDLNNAKFLTAGLKRLLNQDFVHNYSRLFVVSIGEVETMRDSAINLLVHSRRYRLPEHWSHLVDALSRREDGV